MLVTHLALFIHQHQGWHTAQFEQVDFLFVNIGDGMFGVRQANKWQVFILPVALESSGVIRPYGDDFRLTGGESRIVIAQAREMGAAVGSHKAAQEDQDNVFLVPELEQADRVALDIGQFKIGCGG
jgi:hypothetical protein